MDRVEIMEAVEALEAGGDALMRISNTEQATTLYGLALRLRYQGQAFECDDIDESAGLAEARVYEIQSYSKKVPCQ